MGLITLPSLIIWGNEDGVIPVAMAQHANDALGTPDTDKTIFILPNAGHYSFYEQPELCAQAIGTFVEKYK